MYTVLLIVAVTLSSTNWPAAPPGSAWPPVPVSPSSSSILNFSCVAVLNDVLVLA